MKSIDKNLLKKFVIIFISIYIVFILLYIIGFTIDNMGKLYTLAKDKMSTVIAYYKYNIIMAIFYIFPFTLIFSTILLYLFFYLKRENISIFITGYRCVPFKKMLIVIIIILGITAYGYYDFIFTNNHIKDKKLLVKFYQNQKYRFPLLKISYKNNFVYLIIGKVYNMQNSSVEDIYFYNLIKKIEIFAKKSYIYKNLLIFKNVKILINQKSKLKKSLILYIENIKNRFSKVFSTIDGLNSASLLTFFKITGNKVFLFELFRRISYILNGIFISLLLISSFSTVITKTEFFSYITNLILLTIAFISIYFFIFLLAKNLYNIYLGVILWVWELLILAIISRKLILNE